MTKTGIYEKRIKRERLTIKTMIEMFCFDVHKSKKGDFCHDCLKISAYALSKIEKCPFVDDKPTCVRCPVHCYRPAEQEQVRKIMRYSGPKMIIRHPILAIFHILDGQKKIKT